MKFRLKIFIVVALIMEIVVVPLAIWSLLRFGKDGFLWVFMPSMTLYVACGVWSVYEFSHHKFWI